MAGPVSRRPVVAVAHRGDPYRLRENTLASIRSGAARGAGAVETDVRLTGDGVPVLLHDSTLERLWGHPRRLADVTAAEVAELTGGGVPTLREALLGTDCRLQLDLPGATPAAVRTMAGVVRDCGASERVYWTGAPSTMLAVRAAEPGAEIAMTWKTVVPPLPSLLAAVRPRWVNYRFALATPEVIARGHRDGVLVSAWTVDTGRTMRRLVRSGIDALTTNRIDVLVRLLAG
ncbi:glycerophosphodiester phosphodiesterase [Streptomyces sp. NBC_01497]|uniref:glycerophosphodiester phosphodiesterase n=1 Tax=Streptomyces sp. NBC_01497 TaxID=2903885 RepID=UPI003FCE1772